MSVKSPVRTRTPTFYLDFEISPDSEFEQKVPEKWTTFVYTLEGTIHKPRGQFKKKIQIVAKKRSKSGLKAVI